ncbi:hypothetical protein [Streptomyces sp. JH14]|uniref:hypothetical protein n=1 Tax=Streptomyces sp. JH14 TaxID=2793630 RepID=UPI003211CC74
MRMLHDLPAEYGDGRAVDCVPAIASEWDKPGIPYGMTARQCTREEFAAEVRAQLTDAVGIAVPALLDADGSTAARCTTWGPDQPPEPEPFKRIDEVRFGPGLSNTVGPGERAASGAVRTAEGRHSRAGK